MKTQYNWCTEGAIASLSSALTERMISNFSGDAVP